MVFSFNFKIYIFLLVSIKVYIDDINVYGKGNFIEKGDICIDVRIILQIELIKVKEI